MGTTRYDATSTRRERTIKARGESSPTSMVKFSWVKGEYVALRYVHLLRGGEDDHFKAFGGPFQELSHVRPQLGVHHRVVLT